jgi:hypothetical protein
MALNVVRDDFMGSLRRELFAGERIRRSERLQVKPNVVDARD